MVYIQILMHNPVKELLNSVLGENHREFSFKGDIWLANIGRTTNKNKYRGVSGLSGCQKGYSDCDTYFYIHSATEEIDFSDDILRGFYKEYTYRNTFMYFVKFLLAMFY